MKLLNEVFGNLKVSKVSYKCLYVCVSLIPNFRVVRLKYITDIYTSYFEVSFHGSFTLDANLTKCRNSHGSLIL